MECNFTIGGWREPEQRQITPDQPVQIEDTRASVAKFLNDKLKIAIPEADILQSYCVGPKTDGRNRLLFFQCERRWSLPIKNNAKLLKDEKNQGNFTITQQMPDGIIAQRGKLGEELRKIKEENKGKEFKDKKKYTIKQGRLFVEGEAVEDKVLVPSMSDIFPTDEDQFDLDKIEVKTADTITEGKSEFIGMASGFFSVNDVKQIYRKVKQDHAAVDHVVMAYRKEDEEGSQDDGEHRAGKRLLQLLQDKDKQNVVVFVARYYSGVHIGPQRFQCILDSARAALSLLPDN